MIGTQVLQFKILDKVGQGGMGEVFLAEDTQLERRVALKFLPEHLNRDPEFKARFQHEAKAAAALNHPNIITVHQIGEHEGRLFIAMELVEGRTLEERIKAGDISTSEAVDLVQQICEGLGAAHETGIVHRDVKPANILITSSGRAKILDFGLAKSRQATTETRAGTTVGTVQYESPEQSRGDKVDGRSDLFSLGVVLYEAVTAQRPFKGEFEEAVRYAIAHESPEPLARYKAEVPDELQRIVTKLLEKDPDLRYQTAAGLNSDLKTLKRDSGPRPSGFQSAVQTATPSAVTPISAPRKKSPARMLIPAALVVLVLALLLVFKPWNIAIQPSQEATAAEDRLAVMYFDNLSDPEDKLRQGEVVSSLLISDLSESKYMQVVSSQRLYDILKQLGREGERTISPDVATEVAHKARARWMLTGRILEGDPNWVIAAQLSDVVSGDLISSPTISGQPGERVYEVVDRLTAQIKQELALPAEALAELDPPIVQLTSGSPEAYRLYLEAREFSNRLMDREAEEYYRRALELDSTFAMAHLGLAWARLSSSVDFAGANESIRRAVRYFEHASERDQYMIRSLAAMLSGQFDGAIRIALNMIERYPEDKDAYSWLGRMYSIPSAHHDPAKAIEVELKVIDLDPLDRQAYNQLAYLYDEQGNFERSIWAINKYIELAPDEPNPYDSRGELYANNGDIDQALSSYLKALELKPDFISSIKGTVAMYMFREEYTEAEKLIATMTSHADPEVRSQGRRMWCALPLHQGKFLQALKRANEAIETDRVELGECNALAWELGTRADIYAYMGDYDTYEREWTATEELMERLGSGNLVLGWGRAFAIEKRAELADGPAVDSSLRDLAAFLDRTGMSDSGAYWYARGFVALYRRQGDSAVIYFERLCRTSQRWSDQVSLGRAYLVAGRLRDAIHTLERALEVYDESRWSERVHSVKLHYWLGQAYERAGRTDQAIAQYRRFLHLWRDADVEVPEIVDAKSRLAELQA